MRGGTGSKDLEAVLYSNGHCLCAAWKEINLKVH